MMLGKGVHKFLVRVVLVFLVVSLPGASIHAENLAKTHEKLQAAILVKVLSMSKEISQQDEIVIQVVNDAAIAAELQKAVGRKIGKAMLVSVNECAEIVSDSPTAMYIGDSENIDALLRYCRQHHILSMTGSPELIEEGVTLAIGSSGEKPHILLNVVASTEERITWSPVLLKLATIYKQ